jgi:TolB-like protein/DNA-binding winged helix-turn-helix (wHTH) protein/tetratricopeptide (TPR) repeat protein
MIALGAAQLDVEKQEITVGGRTIALQRKPYLVLLHLIENRHRMVHRKELLDRFWDGKEVYDQSLSKAVGSIRKAFGEPTGSELIETRWGLGYRYIGPFVELPVPSPASAPSSTQPPPGEDGDEDLPLPSSGEDVSVASNQVSQARNPARLARLTADLSRNAKLSLAALLTLLLALLAFTAFWFHRRHTVAKLETAPSSIRSVAVLPFTAGSEDLKDQAVALELADVVANRLSTMPQLSVRSPATVRSIVGSQREPVAAAKKLEVQSLITGEVGHAADRVVISVQLVDASTGASRWASTFSAGSADIFSTEDSIAQQLSRVLIPHSEASGLKPFSGPGTNQPDAYSYYMKAKFFATNRTRSSLEKAIVLLNQATRTDPDYARAYAALADCYSLQGFYQYVSPAVAYPQAKEAALKALSLDNSLIEAHVSLLSILTDYDWDWKGAEREFRATIALDPNYAVAYQYYGYTLLGMGRGEEALVAMKHAAQIDPVSPSVQTSLGWAYYLLRENQHAADQCNRVLELYPDYVPAHQLLGIVYGRMGSESLAIAELKRAGMLEHDNAVTPIVLDYELARSGQQAAAARSLASIEAESGGSFVPDYYLAAAWVAIGDKQKAKRLLERALQARSNWIIYLRYDPRFDDLRPDRQFQAILHRIDASPFNPESAQR